MNYEQILDKALALIGGGSPALFSTLGEGGFPHTRWMVPCALPRLKGMVYAVTARGFPKVAEIEADPRVQWVLQAPDFSEVAVLLGRARLVDDPSFAAEVLKAIGPHLVAFWRLAKDPSSLRVVETEVISASLLLPTTGERYSAPAPSAGEVPEAGRG
jgi:general stress protein 26